MRVNRSFWGEGDPEVDIEVAMRHRVLVEGHPFPWDSLVLFVLEDLPRSSGDQVTLAIEMFEVERHPSQRLQKRDFFDVDDVCAFPLELLVRENGDPGVHVSCHNSGHFVTLSCLDVVVAVRGTRVHCH